MTLTRGAEVIHLLDNILITDDPSSRSSAQVDALLRHHPPDKIREILNDPNKIKALKIKDADGTERSPDAVVIKRLLALQPFMNHCQNDAGPSTIVPIHIPSLTRVAFERYIDDTFDENNPTVYDAAEARQNYRALLAIGRDAIPFQDTSVPTPANNNNNNTTAVTGTAPPPPRAPVVTAAEQKRREFQKVKKNSESYSELTAVKQFYPWWKILKTRAHYEKCGTVLNPTYVPGPDEGEAFEEMKLYLFTVFDATIKEIEGKNIVDRFRHNFDAQGCAAALYQYYTNSPAAGIRRDKLFVIITTQAMPQPLTDTRCNLFSKFKALITQYNDMAPPGLEMTPLQEVQYMAAFISPNKEMQNVAQTITNYRLLNNRPMTPLATIELIESTAAYADKLDTDSIVRVRRKVSKSSRRSVNFSSTYEDDEEFARKHWRAYHASLDFGTTNEAFVHNVEIEMDREIMNTEIARQEERLSELQLYRTVQDKGSRIDGEAWKALSEEDKSLIRKLSSAGKDIIASYFRGTSESSVDEGPAPTSQRGKAGSASRNQRRANLAETEDTSVVEETVQENAVRSVQQHVISTSYDDPFADTSSPPNETLDLFKAVQAPPASDKRDEISLPPATNICRMLSAHKTVMATEGLDVDDVSVNIPDETIAFNLDIAYESAAEETKDEIDLNVFDDMPELLEPPDESSSDDDLSDTDGEFTPVISRRQRQRPIPKLTQPTPPLTEEQRKEKKRAQNKKRNQRRKAKARRERELRRSDISQVPSPVPTAAVDSPFSANSFQIMMSMDSDSDDISVPSPRRTFDVNVVEVNAHPVVDPDDYNPFVDYSTDLRPAHTRAMYRRPIYIDRGCNIPRHIEVYMEKYRCSFGIARQMSRIAVSTSRDRLGDVGYSADPILLGFGNLGSRSLRRNINAFMTLKEIRVSALKAFVAKALIDRGANGTIVGADFRLIAHSFPPRTVDLKGIDEHKVPNLKMGTYGAVIETQRGKIIGIIHDGAGMNRGKTIISALQLEHNGVTVDDRPVKLGGSQSLTTVEGYVIPLDVVNGLCYVKARRFTDEEYMKYPHVDLTRDVEWDPTTFDSDLTNDESWFAKQADDTPVPLNDGYTHDGVLIHRSIDNAEFSPEPVVVTTDIDDRPVISVPPPPPPPSTTAAEYDYVREFAPRLMYLNDVKRNHFFRQTKVPLDFEAWRPYFLGQPADVIKKTFEATTQFYKDTLNLESNRIIQPQKSPYPANNVTRRNEVLSTDLVIGNAEAWGGFRLVQLFVGCKSIYIDVYGMRKESEFPGVLEDVIREKGAPNIIGSDFAGSENSNKIKNILRRYCIDKWTSEPHCQWQNFAERTIQEAKKFTIWVLDTSGAPPEAWVLALEYTVFIWNRTARKSLDWRTPHEALFGQTPDTSILFALLFWEEVLIKNYQTENGFPSESDEIPVRMVGFAENVGHSITFKLWNEDTQRLIYRSQVKKINELNYNRRVLPDPNEDEDEDDNVRPPAEPPPNNNLRLHCEQPGNEDNYHPPTLDPSEFVGKCYLRDVEENGERYRAKILECIEEFEGDLKRHPERVKFKTKVGDDLFEEVVEYSDILNFIEEQEEWDVGVWKFREIIGHKIEKRVKKVLIEWESGERSWEPASEVWKLGKYELAKYCKEHGLLDKWTTKGMNLRKTAGQEKKLLRAIKQAKLRSYRTAPVYQYGYQVPRNHQQAVEIDKENGNTKWQDSERLEIHQMQNEYSSFRDMGHKSVAKVPQGYKRITLHFVYAVKHDGRHKSRLVAGGHLTDTPVESVYAGVVSLRGVRLVIFLAELNGLDVWQTDIGNAYLEARTKEKVYFIAGAEFASFGLEEHALMIVAAVYGLKSSGKRWHDCLADVMRDMGFSPCQAEPDIWMRECRPDGSAAAESDTSREGHYYEYVAVYTDDLTIASKNPKGITDAFENVYKFKLKGTGPLSFLLGCDYFRDSTGTLCQQPKRYIAKMEETFERLFGKKPKHYTSPLEKGDHPECDTSELLGVEETKIYQSMIGAAQWLIQLGRFDIAVHVMTLSSFRASPRRGHLDRIKRVYGYVSKMKHGVIRYRTGLPDVSDLNYAEQDWSQTPYAGSKEEVPKNAPRALGKPVRLMTYGDANLMHDLLTGKAVTGLLHFINKTPFDWYSRKQNTVETATYGAESIAGRTAIEQIRANKLMLHYMGVPIEGECILIGDNKTAVDAAVLPESKLHRRHLMLSFHYLKAALATGAFKYVWVDGKDNVSDVLTKHWGYQQVWPILKPVLFWEGDTMDILRDTRKAMKSVTKRLRGK